MKCECALGCDSPAMYSVLERSVCAECLRSCFGALHQHEAVLIPQCEGIDPDLGARCPERTYDRLCEGCREAALARELAKPERVTA